MYIIIQCPRCGRRWWLGAMAADRRIRCRKCFTLLRVPNLTDVPVAAEIISQAKSHLFVDDSGRTYA